jgi:hypothetical protein
MALKQKRRKTVLAPIVTILDQHKDQMAQIIIEETTQRSLMQKWQTKTPRIVIGAILETLETKEDALWILDDARQRIEHDDYTDADLRKISKLLLTRVKEMYQDAIHDIVAKEVNTLDKYLSDKSHSKISEVYTKELEKSTEENKESDQEA